MGHKSFPLAAERTEMLLPRALQRVENAGETPRAAVKGGS